MNYDSFIDYCFFLYVNIMFIVYNVSGTMGLTFPGLGYVFFDIPMQREALTTAVCCHFGAMLTPGCFPFQHPIDVRTVSTPV